MQSVMVRLSCDAGSRPPPAGTRSLWKTPARCWAGSASCCSQNSSPACGVCQILARSCHSNPGSPTPAASVTQDRTSSGRVETTRTTSPPPQSCPTRSAGSSRRSSCVTSQAAYSSIVAPNPSGRTPSNPGSHRATLSGRPSAASRPLQTTGVSGTPWTKTAVMAPSWHSGEVVSQGNDRDPVPGYPGAFGHHLASPGRQLRADFHGEVLVPRVAGQFLQRLGDERRGLGEVTAAGRELGAQEGEFRPGERRAGGEPVKQVFLGSSGESLEEHLVPDVEVGGALTAPVAGLVEASVNPAGALRGPA